MSAAAPHHFSPLAGHQPVTFALVQDTAFTTRRTTFEMPKEKNYNPVQAQRKADKARAIKKGMQASMEAPFA